MDGRRRRWIAFDADFFGNDVTHDLLDRFGPAGVVVWIAFLTACKRNLTPGQITVLSDADTLAQLGLTGLRLVDSAGDNWELETLWRRLGQLKQTRVRRRGHAQDIVATRWEHWQHTQERDITAARKRRSRAENTGTLSGQYEDDTATYRDSDRDRERDITPQPPSGEGGKSPAKTRATKPNPGCPWCEGTGLDPDAPAGDGICRCTRSPNRKPRPARLRAVEGDTA